MTSDEALSGEKFFFSNKDRLQYSYSEARALLQPFGVHWIAKRNHEEDELDSLIKELLSGKAKQEDIVEKLLVDDPFLIGRLKFFFFFWSSSTFRNSGRRGNTQTG